MLTADSEDVTERWREYIEELYAKDEKRTFIPLELEEEVDIDSIGPDLLREGIRELADWLVLFVCFNLAVASGLFCSGLGKRASQTRAANHTPPLPSPPDYDISHTKQIQHETSTQEPAYRSKKLWTISSSLTPLSTSVSDGIVLQIFSKFGQCYQLMRIISLAIKGNKKRRHILN